MSTSNLIRAARDVWPTRFPPPDSMGVESGIVWAIVGNKVMGGMCGYALIPAEGHPWSAGVPSLGSPGEEYPPRDYDKWDIHGGITFYEHPWLGFDTLHYGDVWPEGDLYAHRFPTVGGVHTTEWTPDMVVAEALKLAGYVASVTR